MATFSETDEALMLAYVYGELSASDARAFEKRLDAEADLRAEVDGMKAAHSLFGRDQDWGVKTGIDLPPPHLVDAIVRAEQMARVPAVREAMLKKASSTSSSSLTAKLARWLIGGGVLIAGAAALILVINRSPAASEMSAPIGAAQKTAAAPPPAPAPPPPPPETATAATLEAAKPAEEAAARVDVAEKQTDKKEAEKADKDSDLPGRVAAAGKKAGDAFSNVDGLASLNSAPASAMTRGAGGGRAGLDDAARDEKPSVGSLAEAKKLAKEQALENANAKAKAVPAEMKAAASTSGYAGDFGGAAAGAPVDAPAASAGPMAQTQTKAPAPAKNAPPPLAVTTPMMAPKVAAANEPSPDVLSDDEARARREAVMHKRSAKEKSQPQKLDIERQKRDEAANLAYTTGTRELGAKNYGVALDALLNAEHLDSDASLGALPLVGQMKALAALKRPADAAKIARRIASSNAKITGVVDGWLLGVQIAQQIGDDRLERELWTRLLDVPAHHAEAQAALDRLAPRYRAKADRQYNYDAESERPAPAAAAPPPAAESKSKE